MKKPQVFLAVLIGLLALMTPLARAQGADALLEDSLTDNLASAEDVRWYSFEMSEPGDAVLIVTGLQEYWDGYSYHWTCAICEEDRKTIITWDSVRGYSKNNGPSIISVPGLSAGKYYIQMAAAKSSNPLMTAFTTEPYKIQLLRYYPSASASFEASDRVQTFQNAGDVLWAFDGTAFLKLYDGECYGALMESADGTVVPVLIGAEKNAVAYIVTSTGQIVTAGSPWHHEGLGDGLCYYSECRGIGRYTDASVDTAALPMLYVDAQHSGSVSSAAKIIADRLTGAETAGGQPSGVETDPGRQNEAAGDGSESQQKKTDPWPTYLGAGVVVLIVLSLIPGKRSSKPSRHRSSYPSGGHGSYFEKTTTEIDLFKGGANGCGIAGSFCGCGSGK